MPSTANNCGVGDREFFLIEYDKAPVKPPEPLISEYIQGKRIMPSNTPFPGFWNNGRSPYTVEIMDNMSPVSPVQHQAVMKGAQIGLTAACENVVAYWMDEFPAEILYTSATEELLGKWATKRLEPLIDSCGFRHKIYAQTENRSSRRTGDKVLSKEFVGGNLSMASAQSASGLRSDSIRVLLRDEIDGAPPLLRTGEGNWLEVSYARTFAWGPRKKILDFSTPTTWEESEINKLFERGDQRKFMVRCPFCGKPQELKFGSEQTLYGIKAETKAGSFIQAYYMCAHCREPIFNHHKTDMLATGMWEPTAKSEDPTFRSYHISSLYSPVGMLSWNEVWKKYQNAVGSPDGMRAFTNLYLGLPFKESGSKPDIGRVIELRGGYRSGTVPRGYIVGDNQYVGPLYLTAGIDVQRGSDTDENNPQRLEMDIVATGPGYRTWGVAYKVFHGKIDDPFSGAWQLLHEWAVQGGLTFGRFNVSMVFIDSGDGNFTDVVYRFAKRWQNTYPSKGFGALKKRKTEAGDEAGPENFKRYRVVKLDEDTALIEISTNYYKTNLYNNLKISRLPLDPQKPGFCDFPVDYNEKYFMGLTAEEKRSDGSFHCPSGTRNEALDCRVMANCAADFYLDAKVSEFKAAAKVAGATIADLSKITHRIVIDRLADLVRRSF